MQWSFRIGHIGATDIKIHSSFILIVAYVLFLAQPRSLRDALFPLLLLAALFACVTLHELGHTLVARRFGIGVRSIVLWPLGGFAMLSREPSKPIHQILIAAAGPLVNGVIVLIAQLARHSTLAFVSTLVKYSLSTFSGFLYTRSLLDFVISVNISLALFNLLPAYPLDGGRMLRAALQLVIGPRRTSPVMLGLSWLVTLGIASYGLAQRDPLLISIAALVFLGAGTLSERFTGRLDRVLAPLIAPGLAAHRKGDYAKAIAIYDRKIARNQRNAMDYNNRGAAYYHSLKYEQALSDYNHAIALQPDFLLATQNRLYLYYYRGEYDLALSDIERVCELEPTNADMPVFRAYVHYLNGDGDQALAEFQQLTDANAPQTDVFASRSIVYLDQQLFDLARRDLEQALQLDPHNAYNNLAYMEYILGNHDAGLRSCERGIQFNANLPNLFTTRAEIYTAQGQIEQAIENYDQAIQLNPHDHEPRVYRSLAHFLRGDIERSRADFEHVLALAPRKALIYDRFTLETKVKPNLAWAMMCYQRAADLHPNEPLVYQGRGDAYRVSGALDRAIESYDRAIQLAPQQAGLYLARGGVHQQLGNTDRALADFTHATDLPCAPHLRRQAQAELHKLQPAFSNPTHSAEPLA